jgi:hypothetical protein
MTTNFNELMNVISYQVQNYLTSRITLVVDTICKEYDLSYDQVMKSVSDVSDMTTPVMKKSKLLKMSAPSVVVETIPEEPTKRTQKPVPEPATLHEPAAVVVTEPVLKKPTKRTKKPLPEPTTVTEPELATNPEPVLKKPTKRTKKPESVMNEPVPVVLKKPTKRTKKPVPVAQDMFVNTREVQIEDLPADEQAWFRALLNKDTEPEHEATEELHKPTKRAKQSVVAPAPVPMEESSDDQAWFQELLRKNTTDSYFPDHDEMAEDEMADDTGISDDEDIIDDYDKYVLDE